MAKKGRRTGHINYLQIEAQFLAVRHMASCPSTHGHWVIALVNNTTTLVAIAKGRSSAFTLKKHVEGFQLSFSSPI